MGCLHSAPPVTPEGNEVDAMLNAAREQEEFNPKILLLGAGESGKSTVIKQIKLIWKVGGGLSERDKLDYRNALRRNTIESILVLIEASKTLNIPLGPEASTMAKEVSALQSDADLDDAIAKKIFDLWQDPGIQSVFARRSEYWNLDATPYYLNEVHRFASDFDPTEDDVLMARIRTTGPSFLPSLSLTAARNRDHTGPRHAVHLSRCGRWWTEKREKKMDSLFR
jgi:hypothetical protein